MKKLTVILPAYNEEENIKRNVLHDIETYLSHQTYLWEVIVVDDGSIDQTASLISKWIKGKVHWKLIKNGHLGKAQTVKTGVLAASGDEILFSDFDQATPLFEVEKLFPFVERGYDVVIGSREIKGSERLKEPWYRHLMGKVFNMVVQFFTIQGIHDTQCGFKLFSNGTAKELFNSMVVYASGRERVAFTGAFDVELLYIAQKRGYRIAEVPVSWKYVRSKRVSPLRDSARMFVDVLRIRLADMLGKYR